MIDDLRPVTHAPGPPVPTALGDRPPVDAAAFAERVMSAVQDEPRPTPTRSFTSALRARSLLDAASALAVAWHLGTVRAWSVAPGVRARSMALVLAVSCVLVTGSLAAAGVAQMAVEPIGRFFQAGTDEQGSVENQKPGPGDGQGSGGQDAGGGLGDGQAGTDHDAGVDTNDSDTQNNDGAHPGASGDADGAAGETEGASDGSHGDGDEDADPTEEPDEPAPTAEPGDSDAADDASPNGSGDD